MHSWHSEPSSTTPLNKSLTLFPETGRPAPTTPKQKRVTWPTCSFDQVDDIHHPESAGEANKLSVRDEHMLGSRWIQWYIRLTSLMTATTDSQNTSMNTPLQRRNILVAFREPSSSLIEPRPPHPPPCLVLNRLRAIQNQTFSVGGYRPPHPPQSRPLGLPGDALDHPCRCR